MVTRSTDFAELFEWVSKGVQADGGSTRLDRKPVPPGPDNPLLRHLAAGFGLADLASSISPPLRPAVAKLAAQQIAMVMRQVEAYLLGV